MREHRKGMGGYWGMKAHGQVGLEVFKGWNFLKKITGFCGAETGGSLLS